VIEGDYPAAHSMDTTWYAVDEAGHVAAFDSGDNGSVPDEAHHSELAYQLWQLWYPGTRPTESVHTGLCTRLGLYHFEFDDTVYPVLGPYQRQMVPDRPTHVDQLPPDLRQTCTRFRFDRVDFAVTDRPQPLEHWSCRFWRNCSGYVLADGRTVRLVPGRERDFWSWFGEQLREPNGDLTRFQLERLEVTPDRVTIRSIPGDQAVFWDFFRRLSREHSALASRFYFELNADGQ
jgi:hypothetical protein